VARFADEGQVDPLLAALLHVPETVEAVMPMTRYVTEASTLSPSHRSLVALRTAWLDRSEAVWATLARRAGEARRVVALTRGQTEDDGQVGLLLVRLADELVLTAAVTDATWGGLADKHDVVWLMDAVETVAHVSFLCCLASSFGVRPEIPAGGEAAGGILDLQLERPAAPASEPPLTAARIEPLEGDQIAVLRTFARHPAMTAARRPRAAFVNRLSPLTPHDRETLILRMGWDCRSEYEWAKHVGSVGHARQHGVDPVLVAAGPAAAGVSPDDALLMRVADELHADGLVSEGTWSGLSERHGLHGAMSAVFTASSYRATCMSLNAYGVQLEPGDEGFP
jgi:alkylhydroperoxidase family enzyme